MDKEQANFCTYFRPTRDAHATTDDSAADASRAELGSLFGLEGDQSDAAKPDPRATARRAREELDALFGLDEDSETQDTDSTN